MALIESYNAEFYLQKKIIIRMSLNCMNLQDLFFFPAGELAVKKGKLIQATNFQLNIEKVSQ